jgi:hypothetical protein
MQRWAGMTRTTCYDSLIISFCLHSERVWTLHLHGAFGCATYSVAELREMYIHGHDYDSPGMIASARPPCSIKTMNPDHIDASNFLNVIACMCPPVYLPHNVPATKRHMVMPFLCYTETRRNDKAVSWLAWLLQS